MSDLVPASCTTFYTSNMIVGYKGPGTRQFMERMAKNTGYNKNRQDEAQYEKGWITEEFTNNQEKNFDTGRAWNNYGVSIVSSTDPIPGHPLGTITTGPSWFRVLTTVYVTFISHNDEDSLLDYQFQIKSIAAGGFRIKNTSGATRTVTIGIIKHLVLFTGY